MSSGKAEYYALKGMITELPPERQQVVHEAAQQVKELMAKGEDQMVGAMLAIMELAAKS